MIRISDLLGARILTAAMKDIDVRFTIMRSLSTHEWQDMIPPLAKIMYPLPHACGACSRHN